MGDYVGELSGQFLNSYMELVAPPRQIKGVRVGDLTEKKPKIPENTLINEMSHDHVKEILTHALKECGLMVVKIPGG